VRRLSGLPASFGVVVVASLTSCGGSDLVLPSQAGPAAITLVAGNDQSGPAGQLLALPLVVQVLGQRGEALPDQQVAFSLGTAAPPGAQIDPELAETGTDGRAQSHWVLGNTSGTQTVVASVVGVDGLTVTFNASVGAASAARIELVSGDNQTARIGRPVQDPLIVRVTDGFGNPVAGVTVEWTAQQGSVDPASSVTGEDGQASTTWTLGSSTGPQSAAASSPALQGSPVAFAGTAVPGSADRLERVSGNDQSAPIGTELPEPLVVQLLDQAGNGVPNRAVSWVLATGGGSVSSDNSTTDGNGKASTRWTLGPSAGGNSLNAVVSGVGVVGFNATATNPAPPPPPPQIPSRLAFSVQPSDTEEDHRIEPPVQVVVLDEAGSLVTQGEFEITLELVGDGQQGRGHLDGKRTKHTQSGVATFDDLSVKRDGDYRLRALTDGLPSVESDEFDVEDD
jgi:hypothetical protein